MNFLAPLFLAGAAAVALPFIFHLIRRSSRERVPFSSLMFLEPSPPRITRRSRLEHLLLLLCRCAVLCLLAFAFARPFLPRPIPAVASGGQNSLVAVLVDTSASMRRADLWTQAKARAIDAVRALRSGDQLAVYTFDRQIKPLLGFEESARLNPAERVAIVETRLQAASPSWFGTQLGRVMVNAAEELLDRLNRDAKEQGTSGMRLVVVSDMQSGAHLDGAQGFEWPKKLQVELAAVRTKAQANAGVQVLEENRRTFSAVTNRPVRLRIVNGRESNVEQFALQWRSKSGLSSEKQTVYVPAGQSRIAPAPERHAGDQAIILTGDAIEFDNTAYAAELTAPPVTIAFLGPDSPENPQGLAYYLRRAFEQTNLSTRLLSFSNAIPVEAASSSLFIVGQSLTRETADFARNLLNQGRTILLPLRGPEDSATVRELTGATHFTVAEAPVSNFGLFGRIDFQAPLFAPFSDARFSDFTKIHFWKYRNMDVSGVTNANVLAEFDSGSPLLVEAPVEKGRVLILGSTWTPAESQLALSSKFVPLLFGILEQSVHVRDTAHQYSAGDGVFIPAGVNANAIILPDGTRTEFAGGSFVPAVPGIYKAGDFEFAVNVDPSESKLTPLAPEELSNLGVPLKEQPTANEVAVAAQRQHLALATETESRQKLWRNFLIAAIAFVFLETYLAGRFSRQATPA